MSTYTIPKQKLENLKDLIKALNKKATKLSLPPITLDIGNSFNKKKNDYYVPYVEVTVEGQVPIIQGWRLLAVVDHDMGDLNIIKNLPWVESVPNADYYRQREPFCDHCHTRKVKKTSFLIQNAKTGKMMQVGSTCLKDFFDLSSINDYVAYVTSLLEFEGIIDPVKDDEEYAGGEGGGGSHVFFDVKDVMTVAFAAVRLFGYKKVDSDYPTKTAVSNHFSTKERLPITQEDKENAEKAFEWIISNQSSSDFMISLRQIISLKHIPSKYFGYVCGAIPAFLKAQSETGDVNNEHFGNIKERMKMTLTPVSKQAIAGHYGISYLYKFLDDQNRSVVWFASKDPGLTMNTPVTVTASIKKHDVYNGIKQTHITRLKKIS